MKIFWLDVETTGLEPTRDVLLELAIAEADLERPFDIGPVRSWVFPLPADGTRPVTLSPFILDMHTKNGLLAECARSTETVFAVEERLLSLVPAVANREDTPALAGSSVHFDHAFLREHMPRLAARFSHRHYDVSAVKLFCRSLGMKKVPKAEAHRAADDVRESVAHARLCAKWLRDENISGFTYAEDRSAAEAPDAHCVTTPDGGCVSEDPRDMHQPRGGR
jgi:oligoribonuclease